MIFNQFISAVVKDPKGLETWRKLERNWLLEEEQAAYDAIQGHIEEYTKLPGINTLEDFGFKVEDTDEEPKFYLKQVELRKQIHIINKSSYIVNEALASRDIESATKKLDEVINDIRSVSSEDLITTLDVETKKSLAEYKDALYGYSPVSHGITTGFPFIDNLNGGLYPGNLIVISGRPEAGKTMIEMYMALSAWADGKTILISSAEMSVREMTDRLACMDARVDSNIYLKRKLDYWALEKVEATLIKFEARSRKNPAYFLDASSGNKEVTILDIERVIAEKRPQVAYIDAIYLFSMDGNDGNKQEWQIVSKVLNKLKKIAERYNITIVVTGQMNKSAANSKKILTLDQMADTDNFGKIAHLVIGIRRGQGLNSDKKREIGILKNRLGPGTGEEYTINFLPSKADFSESLGDNIPVGGGTMSMSDFYNKR